MEEENKSVAEINEEIVKKKKAVKEKRDAEKRQPHDWTCWAPDFGGDGPMFSVPQARNAIEAAGQFVRRFLATCDFDKKLLYVNALDQVTGTRAELRVELVSGSTSIKLLHVQRSRIGQKG